MGIDNRCVLFVYDKKAIDAATMALFLGLRLEEKGLVVKKATDYNEAISIAVEEEPPIILFYLPTVKMDSCGIIREIKKSYDGNINIRVLPVGIMPDECKEARHAGANRIYDPGQDLKKLTRAIVNYVNRA